jgi:hypothetical protein
MRTLIFLFLLLFAFGSGCTQACEPTEPVLAMPPPDNAVLSEPVEGLYFINEDSTIWASGEWAAFKGYGQDLEAGIKVGWFRPAGEELVITGRRLDGNAPPFEAHIPCCYPTRFQATGLYFPTPGCWEITATAGESSLTFRVVIESQE